MRLHLWSLALGGVTCAQPRHHWGAARAVSQFALEYGIELAGGDGCRQSGEATPTPAPRTLFDHLAQARIALCHRSGVCGTNRVSGGASFAGPSSNWRIATSGKPASTAMSIANFRKDP